MESPSLQAHFSPDSLMSVLREWDRKQAVGACLAESRGGLNVPYICECRIKSHTLHPFAGCQKASIVTSACCDLRVSERCCDVTGGFQERVKASTQAHLPFRRIVEEHTYAFMYSMNAWYAWPSLQKTYLQYSRVHGYECQNGSEIPQGGKHPALTMAMYGCGVNMLYAEWGIDFGWHSAAFHSVLSPSIFQLGTPAVMEIIF